MSSPVLELRDVAVRYRGAATDTLSGLSLAIHEGESVGLVGESGAGKSTILKTLLGLLPTSAGTLHFDGEVLNPRDRAQLRRFRGDVQTVFQDPYSSLDPRARIGRTIAEPLRSLGLLPNRQDRASRAAELLDSVGLPAEAIHRYPAEFSGGQRQRIAIARALAPNPRLLLADEPVSALDMSVRTRVIELLRQQRTERELAMLLVSHDLAIVAALCERILVVHRGVIVESGPTERVLRSPEHPYTRTLLAAIPRLPEL